MRSPLRTILGNMPFDLVQGGSAVDGGKNLFWLRVFVLMHVASRTIMAQHEPVVGQAGWMVVTSYLLIAVCLVGFVPRCTRLATSLAAALLGTQIIGTMPITANHIFLEFLCLATLALLHESQAGERELAIKALRWLVVIVLFYSGFQKLVYGHYFDGQFFAYATATEDRFASFFRRFMPAEEFARLQGLDAKQLGAGPYRVDSALFVTLSNFTFLFELAAPVLMVWVKTRRFAAIAAIVFVIGVEAGARELLFGALVINLILLYVRGAWVRKLFPLFAGMYAYLLAAEFNLVPMFRYYH